MFKLFLLYTSATYNHISRDVSHIRHFLTWKTNQLCQLSRIRFPTRPPRFRFGAWWHIIFLEGTGHWEVPESAMLFSMSPYRLLMNWDTHMECSCKHFSQVFMIAICESLSFFSTFHHHLGLKCRWHIIDTNSSNFCRWRLWFFGMESRLVFSYTFWIGGFAAHWEGYSENCRIAGIIHKYSPHSKVISRSQTQETKSAMRWRLLYQAELTHALDYDIR